MWCSLHGGRRHLRPAIIALLFVAHGFTAIAMAQSEITYPAADFAKLDTFESLNLEDADKLFTKGDFKGAYASYKAHSLEFTKSAALPYVLLRMGRCLHRLDKRNAAIGAYQEVLDYFPDDIRYAAAALYSIGECHGQNGEEAKQTAAWAKLVKDNDYVNQPQSGTALTFLAQRMAALGEFEEAAEYQWRTAVAFLKSNPQAAAQARAAVLAHYAIRNPNHDKLAEFYTAAAGFDGRGPKANTPENDKEYWGAVLETVAKASPDAREKACRYWAAKFGERFPENDGLRKLASDVQLGADGNSAAWQARMEKQFAREPASLDRVLTWCEWYRGNPSVANAFFEKHGRPLTATVTDIGKRVGLIQRLGKLGLKDEAVAVLRSTKLDGLDDTQLVALANAAAAYEPEEGVMRYFARVKDSLTGAKGRFDYYNARTHQNPPFMEKALAEVTVLEKSPKYAGADLAWAKADLLRRLGRFEEAIKVYREVNKQPDSTWAIAKCLVALKMYPEAVKTVKDLEAVGGPVASQASLEIADIYKAAGEKGAEVKQLRVVLKRYPKSTQSSAAHNRLEAYGVPLVGGESEAED
jgi:tetratricopeptide (TPR) repeat protein